MELPTKPYIKQWMENRYGSQHEKFGLVVELTQKNWEGRYFFNLSAKPKRDRDKRMFNQFPSKISLMMTYNVYMNQRVYLTPTVIIEFNGFVSDMIKQDQRTYVQSLVDAGQTVTDAINKYIELRGFTEESYSFDTIVKDIQRNTNIRKYKKSAA